MNIPGGFGTVPSMKHIFAFSLAAVLSLALAGSGFAACYADYKAKRDKPLRLHYGVIELSDAACEDPGRARAEITERLAAENWNLLTVMSTFGRGGLEKREENAGKFFLRY